MTSESNQRMKSIITSLLAKAKGTDNEHEADAFLAKAMELLQKHQLDISDLVDADDPILHHIGLSQATSGHAWRWKLYSAVAKLYGCKSIYCPVGYREVRGKYTPFYELRIVGRESSIITTDLMYPWIVQQVRELAKGLAAHTGMSEQGQAKRIAAALIMRIHKIISAQEREAPDTAAGRYALVVMDQVAASFDQHYPATKMMRSSRSVSDALSENAANKVSLHRQTSGSSTRQLNRGA